MAERQHNRPSMFSRLDDQITGPVLDAIVIRPRSRPCLAQWRLRAWTTSGPFEVHGELLAFAVMGLR